MKGKLKPLLFSALLMVIYLASQMAVSMAFAFSFTFIEALRRAAQGNGYYDPRTMIEQTQTFVNRNLMLIMAISIALAFFMFLLVYGRGRGRMREFCGRGGKNPVMWVMSVALGVSANLVISFVLAFLSRAGWLKSLFDRYDSLTGDLLGGSFAATILVVGLLVPLFEEFLFRGLIFGELREGFGATAALLIQAALFGVYHFNVIQGVYAAVIGLALGYLRLKSGSIAYPVLMHVAVNASSVLIANSALSDILRQFGAAALAVGLLVFAGAGLVVVKSDQILE